jgi:O-succinylbenzoate synthase
VRDEVPVNALVDRPDFDVTALRRAPAVKVKVGRPGDLDLVAAVRDALGPGVALRVDANGAWDVDTAIDRIERLARYDLEFVEQPVVALADLARVRARVAVPVAADECIRTLDDARELRTRRAADVVVLKQQPLGGVRVALQIAAEAAVPAVVSSMMETSIGLSAGVALALALPELPYACGLDTLDHLSGDVVRPSLTPTGGVLRPRRVTPASDLLARYEDSSQETSR